MITSSLSRLLHLCQIIPGKLSEISDEEFATKPDPAAWSKKEILGHLIDSATHNHHRFVRTQFEYIPKISYDGDQWVNHSRYQSMSTDHLIRFWETYNRHIAEVVRLIPEEMLERTCDSGDPEMRTLGWLIEDYVVHLEHHLHQLVEYV